MLNSQLEVHNPHDFKNCSFYYYFYESKTNKGDNSDFQENVGGALWMRRWGVPFMYGLCWGWFISFPILFGLLFTHLPTKPIFMGGGVLHPENPENCCLFIYDPNRNKKTKQFNFDVVAHPVKKIVGIQFFNHSFFKAVHSFLGVLLVKRTSIGFLLSCRV